MCLGPVAGGIVGGALLSAGMSTWQQKASGKGVDWTKVAVNGAIGGVAGGLGGGLVRAAGPLMDGMNCLGRNVLTGTIDGGASGGFTGGADYLTGPGPHTLSGLAGATTRGAVTNAVTGGVGAGVMSKVLGKACFAADTQVLMGDGSSKSIQDVVVGDEVLAWNQATGENEPRRVVETFVHEGVGTWEVETADGQVVTSTAEHPFWVEGRGWTPVRELMAGDVLASVDGPVGVVRVEATGETARVFNVHVDGLHNYHVGDEAGALRVHNNCQSTALSSRAARRQAMRDLGIPTSAQPDRQILTPAGYSYEYNASRLNPVTQESEQVVAVVSDQTTDRVPGHGPHWEAGWAKDSFGIYNDATPSIDCEYPMTKQRWNMVVKEVARDRVGGTESAHERRIAIVAARRRREQRQQACEFLGHEVAFIDSQIPGGGFAGLHGRLAEDGELIFERVPDSNTLFHRLKMILDAWAGVEVLMSLDSLPKAGLFTLGDDGEAIVGLACEREREGFVLVARDPTLLIEVDRLEEDDPMMFDLTLSKSAVM